MKKSCVEKEKNICIHWKKVNPPNQKFIEFSFSMYLRGVSGPVCHEYQLHLFVVCKKQGQILMLYLCGDFWHDVNFELVNLFSIWRNFSITMSSFHDLLYWDYNTGKNSVSLWALTCWWFGINVSWGIPSLQQTWKTFRVLTIGCCSSKSC